MSLQTKVIGRTPTDHGPYNPNTPYGKKFCVTLFGCMWESLHDNNNTAPAVWDGGDTITPNLVDWKKVSGDYNAWLMNQDKPAQSVDYPFNGMGRVKLLKHVVNGHNLLYQDDFYKDGPNNTRVPNTNTVFEVPYEFELAEDITLPAGSILDFQGGSISAGGNDADTITTDNLVVVNDNRSKIFSGIKFEGRCRFVNDIKLEWFVSAYPISVSDNTIDNTSEFEDCVASGALNIVIPNKFIRLTRTISIDRKVNLIAENDFKKPNMTESRLDLALAFQRPCIFSNNVVTLLSYDLVVNDEETAGYAFPLRIGNIDLVVNVAYNEITEVSGNTPILSIVANTVDVWGLYIDCNITSRVYSANVPVALRKDNYLTDNFFNYTGIYLHSLGGYISYVRINGNVSGTKFGLRGQRTTWFTDIVISGDMICGKGAVLDAQVQPLFVYGNGQSHVLDDGFEGGGFYEGSSILLYGMVWDTYAASQYSNCRTVQYPIKNIGTSLRDYISSIHKTSSFSDIYKGRYSRYLSIYDNSLQSIQETNALRQVLTNSYPTVISNFSYKVDNVSVFGNSNVFNVHNLFNENILATFNTGGADRTGAAFVTNLANETHTINIKFTLDKQYLNFILDPMLIFRLFNNKLNASISVYSNSSTSGDGTLYNTFTVAGSYYANAECIINLPSVLERYVTFDITITGKVAGIITFPCMILPCGFNFGKTYVCTTANRPNVSSEKGVMVFDTSLNSGNGKPIWWNGTAWVDATGTPV